MNAFKYTGDNGVITVNLKEKKEGVSLIIS